MSASETTYEISWFSGRNRLRGKQKVSIATNPDNERHESLGAMIDAVLSAPEINFVKFRQLSLKRRGSDDDKS